MSADLVGRTFGHYKVTEQIGAGGMGVVYRARDERLERDVALKVLPAGSFNDASARSRFRKEALVLARLNHPHIGAVYDFGTDGDLDFLVMEYVAGTTLASQLVGTSLPEREAIAIGAQIARALEEAHDLGVVHRDLKPGNIMVTPKGQAKVLDFGLARTLDQATGASSAVTATATKALHGARVCGPRHGRSRLRGVGEGDRGAAAVLDPAQRGAAIPSVPFGPEVSAHPSPHWHPLEDAMNGWGFIARVRAGTQPQH